MTPRKKTILLIGATVVVAALVLGWWQTERRLTTIVQALPRVPEFQDVPPALRDLIESADTAARRRFGGTTALGHLARVYHANGFLDEAARCYTALETLQPSEPRWSHLHASILAGYGQIEQALALWSRVRTLAPDYLPAHLRGGDALLKINRRTEATAAYETVLKLEPNNPYALLGLARLDLESSQWDSARTRLEKVVSQTNYTLGYDLIVSLYERLGMTQRATEIRSMTKASGAYRDPADPWLDGLIDDCFEPYRLSLAAGAIARNGDRATARRLLERAALVASDNVSVNFQLGTLLVALGDQNGALTRLRRCTELAPDFADGWAHLSALYAAAGNQAAADQVLAEGLRHCPQSPGLHLQFAESLQNAGRLDEAIREFKTSSALRPNEPDAYLSLGRLYLRQGRVREGMAEMERALVAEPGNPLALGVIAMNAITNGDEAEARVRLAAARAQPRVPREQMQQLLAAYRQRFGRTP